MKRNRYGLKQRAAALLLALIMAMSSLSGSAFALGEGEKTAAAEAPAGSSLAGRTLSVLGASISTCQGVSNDASANSTIGNNAVYYTAGRYDIYRADTWWQQAADDLGLRLLVNNSWSGSSLLYERSGTVGAYVNRCVQLHDDTGDNAGEEPDIIGIQMGTNDFQYYKDTLGTADIDYAALVTENTDGTYTYAEPVTSLEAAAIVLHKISVRYPEAEVYYLNISQRVDGTDELIRSFNAELKQVVEHFGAHIVDIYGSAITMENFDTYIGDGRVHPNKLGMDAYTEAFKRALLANTAYTVDTHTVTLDLEGVSANYGDDKIVADGNSFAVNLAAAAGDVLDVTVTMDGKDVTDAVYANGTVSIDTVIADVNITAVSVHEPKEYRWEFDGTDLVCMEGGNALTKNAGTTTDGVFSTTRYALENEVVLLHNLPWVVEWKCSGTFLNTNGSSGARVFTSDDVNANYNARYIFKSNTNGIIAMGEKTTSGSHNYGIALGDYGIDWTALHTYRLENRIADDGTNMIYLFVDGEEIGPMTDYYVGTKSQNTTSGWLSGKDFVFPYMGTDTHGFTNASIDYIQVWEAGCFHNYVPVVSAPTCTEQGYTTYTCTCGDSYVDDYVEATGHSYENGICTGCGVEHPNLVNYDGKVISILGGSTCTFAGHIPVADGFNLAHRPRYPQSNLLTDVNDTWWMQVINELDAKLGINDSWAGSQVLNTQDNNSGDLGPDAAMASLTRIQNLGANGTPDIILFYGAMNDIGKAVTLGSFDPEEAPALVDLTATKWADLADAYVAAVMRMQHYYPDAQIVAMLPGPTASYYTEAERQAYCAVLKTICDHYGVLTVDLSTCGLTTADMPDGTHPNAEGMDYITAAVLEVLLNECEMETGENVVHSVTHELTGAKSSLSYYKGVSHGKSFLTTITGEDVAVTVTMGDADITDEVYADGKIAVPSVTGDILITAKGVYNADGRLQQLPDDYCCNSNLWALLDPVNEYYTTSGWGNNSNSNYSVTISVTAGDRIWATSFGAAGTNGYSANAVRITWFGTESVLKSLARDEVYAEFAEYGYITVPEGAVAVNIPMATNANTWELYILNREHTYTSCITPPTCTEQGYTTCTCTCGDSYVADYVEALGHTKVVDQAVAPTCTETGLTEGKHCSVCGEVLVAQTEVAALGHSFGEWSESKTPTCTEPGEEKRKCASCGQGETRQVEAKGHKYESVVTTPTCTEQGYTTYTCTLCGDSYVADYVDALGHTEVTDSAEAPTCTETGLTEGKHCSVCGEVLVAQTEVAALGHSFGEWSESKTPTCTEPGEEKRECASCGQGETRQVEAKGHKYESVVTAPTCTEQGYTTYTCTLCGDSYLADYVEALGHTEVVDQAAAPTCTETGLTEGKHCSACGEVLTEQKVVDALGHTGAAGLCAICGYDEVAVSVTGGTMTITSKELEEGVILCLAAYDGNGKFLSETRLVWEETQMSVVLPECAAWKLLFFSRDWLPLWEAVEP